MNRQFLEKAGAKQGAYPKEWWEDADHPNRKKFLAEVMQERQEAEESEDGMGNPLYIKERCKNYKMLQEETAKLKTEFADKKAHIIKSNK